MSRLEELKAGLCPDGVEYKRLGDVADYVRGLTYDKYDVVPDGLPVLRANNINLSNTLNFDDVKHVSLTVKDYLYLRKNDILICAGSGSGEHVGKVAFISEDMNCSFGAFMGVVRVKNHDELLPGFLFHVLTSWRFRNYIDSAIHFSTIHNLNAKVMNDFTIPIPPLEVQAEIVRILDKFTSLTAELTEKLTAELTLRRQQYEYYRDKLLTFGDEIPRVPLGEVIHSLRTGLNPRKFFRLNTEDAHNYYITIREMRNGQIIPTDKTDRINDEAMRLCNKRSNLEAGDVLFSGTGTIGETVVIEETPTNWNIKEGIFAIKPKQDCIQPHFLRHILNSSSIKNAYMDKAVYGTMHSITMKDMLTLQIPLLPIEQQIHIASILDRFDSLCNNLSHGLPAEIQARQTQYQYYRDKLLTFKEKSPCQNTAL